MKIKICGLRRLEDIDMVNKYKPDYVGFVFAKSKRQVTSKEAKLLIEKLDNSIKSVGIFVDFEAEKVNEIKKTTGLDIVQLHGTEDLEYCKKIEGTIWKAFRVKDESIEKELEKFSDIAEVLLLDAHVEGIAGGTGKKFDWNLVNKVSKDYKIALAGGINITNIDDAKLIVNPYLLDISSGVEVDGFKDEALIKAVIEKVRRYVLEDFKNLTEVRETIDKLDNEIIKLIAQRSVCVKAASRFKRNEKKVKAPDRVEKIISKIRDLAIKDNLSPDIAENIYRTMIREFINYELNEFKK